MAKKMKTGTKVAIGVTAAAAIGAGIWWWLRSRVSKTVEDSVTDTLAYDELTAEVPGESSDTTLPTEPVLSDNADVAVEEADAFSSANNSARDAASAESDAAAYGAGELVLSNAAVARDKAIQKLITFVAGQKKRILLLQDRIGTANALNRKLIRAALINSLAKNAEASKMLVRAQAGKPTIKQAMLAIAAARLGVVKAIKLWK